MAIVDDHGRLFGRLTLFDAILGLIFLGLVVLGYGAYALFRTPPPQLVAIEPAEIQVGPNLRVTIRGENLRPYMRVSLGTVQGRSFLFEDTTRAQVDLDELSPGTYDVILYDHAQERDRLPQALTVHPTPLPHTEVMVVGSFANLTDETAPSITRGMTIPGVGEIVDVAAPLPESTRVYTGNIVLEIPVDEARRVPVVIRMACQVRAREGHPLCASGDVNLQPNVILLLSTPLGVLPFQVDQVRSVTPPEVVMVRVRLRGAVGVLSRVAGGDRDLGPYVNPLAAGATVERVHPLRTLADGAAERDVELHVMAQRGESSWVYAGGSLRLGGSIGLRTYLYEAQGTVLGLEVGPAGPGNR